MARPASAPVSLVLVLYPASNPRPLGAISSIGQAKRRYIMVSQLRSQTRKSCSSSARKAKSEKSKPAEPEHETPSPAPSKSTSPEAAVSESESAQITPDTKVSAALHQRDSTYLTLSNSKHRPKNRSRPIISSSSRRNLRTTSTRSAMPRTSASAPCRC